MKRFCHVIVALMSAVVLMPLPAPAAGLPDGPLAELRVLTGWRQAGGTHMAALQIRMPDGWHTYWRSPGDAGVPPRFNWAGSTGISGVAVGWPVPQVFDLDGVRTLGYEDAVILPLQITTNGSGEAVLRVTADLGVCKDICVPVTVSAQGVLPDGGQRDIRVATAMADRPLSAARGRVRQATCRLTPTAEGVRVTARLRMPATGPREIGVIESANPAHWVAEPSVTREGGELVLSAEVFHVEDKPLVVDRSGLRFTVLGRDRAVDIRGCRAP